MHERLEVKKYFKRELEIDTLYKSIDSESKLKTSLSKLQTTVESDDVMFKQFYLFTFAYAKSVDQKSMDIEVYNINICLFISFF